MFKSAIIGAVIGGIAALFLVGNPIFGAIVGFFAGIALRKWIFRTFWQ